MPVDELYSITVVAAAFDVPTSTLRYYDEIGLVPAPHRRSGVRHYDRRSLQRLAYVQLWRLDGMLSIEHTTAIIASADHQQRNERLRRSRDELAVRIRGLQAAHDMLLHMTKCTTDDHTDCPVIGTYLDEQVDGALQRLGSREAAARAAAGPTLQRLARTLVGHVDGQDAGRRSAGEPCGRDDSSSE